MIDINYMYVVYTHTGSVAEREIEDIRPQMSEEAACGQHEAAGTRVQRESCDDVMSVSLHCQVCRR